MMRSRLSSRSHRWIRGVVVALVAAAALTPLSTPAASASGGGQPALLVSFAPGMTVSTMRAVVAGHGGVLGEAVGSTGFFAVALSEDGDRSGGLAAALAADPRVAVVEENHVRTAAAFPDDPRYGPHQAAYLGALHLPEAWDVSIGSEDLVLAIVDSGVAAIPELAGRLLPGRDIVNGDNDATDDLGHGTEVASVAAASTNNHSGMAGVAWAGKILPVKVLDKDGKGTDAGIAAGITWAADHGADVINLSLGAPAYSATLRAAVDYARSRDAVVVAAAGNDRSSGIHFPAAIDGVVAVTAVDHAGLFAPYSNWGRWIDLAAPGEVLAAERDGGYALVEGTSYSAAVVSGVALLTRARHPAEAADQIVTRLRGGARDAGRLGVDDRYGYGIVDAFGAVAGQKPARVDDAARLEREPDNTAARATRLPAGTAFGGVLAPEGDVDWFAVDLPSPGWVRVTTSEAAPPAGTGSTGWVSNPRAPDAGLFDADLSAVDEPRLRFETSREGWAYAPAGRIHVRVAYPDRNVVGTAAYAVRVDVAPGPAYLVRDVVGWRNGFARTTGVATGDVTGDALPELVVSFAERFSVDNTTPLGSVAVYSGIDQSATPPQVLGAPAGTGASTDVAVADLDGDGDDDVVAATSTGPVLYERRPDGLSDGRLVPLAGTRHVDVGDIDGDHRPDLAVTTDPGFVWLRNTGNGTFTSVPVTHAKVADAVVGDVTGDGRDDVVALECDPVCATVVVATSGSGGVTLSRTRTGLTGTEPAAGESPMEPDGYPTRCGIGAGDLTADGISDIVAACSDADRLELLPGRPGGGFLPVVASALELSGPIGLHPMDADGDGTAELAVISREGDGVAILQADHDGRLTNRTWMDLNGHIEDGTATFADLDGNGTVDAAAVGNGHGVTVVHRQPVDSELHGPRHWVADTNPANGSAAATPHVTPTMTFARPLDPARAGGVTMTDGSTGEPVDVTATYDGAFNAVVVRPARPLLSGHTYLVDHGNVFDAEGNWARTLEPDFRFTVTGGDVTAAQPDGPAGSAPDGPPSRLSPPNRSGYWMAAADGAIYAFGDARYHGGAPGSAPGRRVVDVEPTPTGQGYWIVDNLGTVTAHGDALPLGSLDPPGLANGETTSSLSATPTGNGYWIFTNRGRAIAFGDAPFLGDVSDIKLNGPVLGSVASPSGQGYYMVASDGGIFSFKR
jgi:subtilisin family serine protease